MNAIDPTAAVRAVGPARLEGGGTPARGDFVELIKGVLQQAHQDQVAAEKQAVALAEGRGDIVDAMLALSKADLSLRFVVTMRNRAVEAYQEIMRLQV